MRIVGDILLFVATSLVFSVTILCGVIQFRARDAHSRFLLYVLIPLTLQLGLAMLSNYLDRSLSEATLASEGFRTVSLFFTIASIFLITVILYSASRYLVEIIGSDLTDRRRRLGNQISVPIAVLFLLASLFAIFFVTRGNWFEALSLTLKYYASWGILFLLPHVIAAGALLPRTEGIEAQGHLRGIIYSFAPVAVLVPLDLIFFRDHYFKLSYLSFAAFSVVVYIQIGKQFVREYDPKPEDANAESISFDEYGLSPREEDTARLLIQGKTNTEIGEELFISTNTVRTHIKSIYRKLEVSNRYQLMYKARPG